MRKVTAAEFKTNIGKYQDIARIEPITITRHDRPSFVLLSFEEYQKLTGNTQRSIHVTQLTNSELEMISKSKVPEKFKHLDDELEE